MTQVAAEPQPPLRHLGGPDPLLYQRVRVTHPRGTFTGTVVEAEQYILVIKVESGNYNAGSYVAVRGEHARIDRRAASVVLDRDVKAWVAKMDRKAAAS